jgi:uncharacterized membrane protein
MNNNNMESNFTISDVLRDSWKAFSSQMWILAGLIIGYIILTLILNAVSTALFSVFSQLIYAIASMILALIFELGYLKNLFQALDGDEPRFSAYGREARKIVTFFVSALLRGLLIFIVVSIMLLPYFYLLYDLSFIGDIVIDPYSAPVIPEGKWPLLFLMALGALCLLLPAIYLGIRFMFYQAFIVDDDAGIIDSLKRSWEITKGHTLSLFLLALTSIGIVIAGFMVFVIGIFVAMPLVALMYCSAFRRLNHYPACNE